MCNKASFIPKWVIKFVKSILLKDFVSKSDEKILADIINNFTNIDHSMLNIININSVHVIINNDESSFNLSNVDCLKNSTHVVKNDNCIIQSNEYMFVICLNGSISIECLKKGLKITSTIYKGEAFSIHSTLKHVTTTKDKNLHLAVIKYDVNCPFIHFKNTVYSEDSFVYNLFSGYNFALFRLYDNYNNKVEDILITNNNVYNENMRIEKVLGIKSLLYKHSILQKIYLDYIPKSNVKYISEIVDLSLDKETLNSVFNFVNSKSVYSNSGNKYKYFLTYGVLCYE
ncbi:hypothetical protein [Tanapox virus]|uniref:Uncharacterized protein 125R n=2 Tax=Tanapox virus TaxID=99000 RepID=A7XCR0_9POXV|nr:125R protein [Yaba-like disease virus]ABQ43601.1 hypothetical protein [Tanapox virus]ABQ43756.1 hypothetical protein [Tanapox virus]CAC21363.1 125R protein [Yaba-like disease virus]